MKQMREFAQQKSDFDKLNASLVAISVDDQEHAKKVWDEVAQHNVTILSDPGARVVRLYGLVHEKGYKDEDIALRTTVVVDEQGNEVFLQLSNSAVVWRHPDEILAKLRELPTK
jgi:peroxiredoxin